MSIEVKVEGTERIVALLDVLSVELKREIDRTVEREAIRVEGYAKEYSPIDTGRLRMSIHFSKISEYKYKVEDGVKYGVYQEFGTSRMPAHPFMIPAIYHSLPEYEAELQSILARIPKV
jgi:HK97 gp10 family phage protein